MYDALKPMNQQLTEISNSKLGKTLNKVSNFRRGVLTEYNPLFSITNALKDAQDVVINSQHPGKTYAKFGEAYAQITQKGYWYEEYIQNGGEQNSYFKDGEFESDKKTSTVKKAISIPLEKISSINNVIEMAPRLAEYIASREAGRSIETSMLDASRVTTNFKAGGDVVKFANKNGATFLNASVQGFQQQIRNIQEARIQGLKGYAVLATKYAIAGLPALLLNNLLWGDDDDYEELQDYAKDNYYCIAKIGDGKFIRIPKGRMASVMQKIVGNASEYLTDKKELNIDNLAKDFWEDLKYGVDNIAPNNPLDNNVISPIIQAITNTSWYGEDIVPRRLQDKPKGEQYDETTDSLSIWLGDKLNVSPYKINYLLDQYGGGISDIALPRMTKQAENNSIEDKFTTDSTMKSRYPGEFYNKADELKVNANSSKATDEDILKNKYASSVSSEMGDLYKKKREIQGSNLTDKEKKEQLKEVQKDINKLAKDALEYLDATNTIGTIKQSSSNIKSSNKETAEIGDQKYYTKTNLQTCEREWSKLTEEEQKKNKDISLSTYQDYKDKIAKETIKQRKAGDIKENGSLNDKSKIEILSNSKYDKKEKQAIYENYIKSVNDAKYDIIKETGLDIDKYLKYKLADLNGEFGSAKKDDGTVKGKTISGSAKQKTFDYISNMKGVTYTQKVILMALEYEPSNKKEKTIVMNYVSSLNKTKKERLDIIGKFPGVTVYKDGTYKY